MVIAIPNLSKTPSAHNSCSSPNADAQFSQTDKSHLKPTIAAIITSITSLRFNMHCKSHQCIHPTHLITTVLTQTPTQSRPDTEMALATGFGIASPKPTNAYLSAPGGLPRRSPTGSEVKQKMTDLLSISISIRKDWAVDSVFTRILPLLSHPIPLDFNLRFCIERCVCGVVDPARKP